MIIITGAAGFIGSCLAGRLNQEGKEDLVLVDDFSRADKLSNFQDKGCIAHVERDQFFDWIKGKEKEVSFFLHMGARTDTTEKSWAIFELLNLEYSQRVWHLCSSHNIPLIYASSAATYGGGEKGFSDDESLIPELQPLNPYGRSKQEFDKWVLSQDAAPDFWAGLKFFNVYGPNEYHKGRMASVVFHAYHQIRRTGEMKLFRSHNPEYADGEQKRDFIYIKDVSEVIRFLMEHRPESGIYNLGTGMARTFKDLTDSVFRGMGKASTISFVDTPADIRDTYQYFTEADMSRLKAAGYSRDFTPLEVGVEEYVRDYLVPERYL